MTPELEYQRKLLSDADKAVSRAEQVVLRMPTSAGIGEITKARGALAEARRKRGEILKRVKRLEAK
jgi:hypothetical protein